VQSVEKQSTFWRNISSPSTMSKNKPREKPPCSRQLYPRRWNSSNMAIILIAVYHLDICKHNSSANGSVSGVWEERFILSCTCYRALVSLRPTDLDWLFLIGAAMWKLFLPYTWWQKHPVSEKLCLRDSQDNSKCPK
jgi:hypothetical protein